MYGFVDTTGPQPEDKLPAEALKLNGKYIEKLDDEKPDDEKSDDEKSVVGYRTLYVSGRELLESEIDDYQVGNSDGTRYRGKRYPPRIITVTYQLVAKDAQAFRASYNKLNRILDVENATLSFHDEEDKYFIGTKSGNSVVTPGKNRVIGEIEFYCADPFKYSTADKEFKATLSEDKKSMEMTIKNDGTKEVPVSYTITHGSENGFVGIVSEHGVIELGKISEADGKTVKMSKTLINFEDISDYGNMDLDNDDCVLFDSGYGKNNTLEPLGEWLKLSKTEMGKNWHGAAKAMKIQSEDYTSNEEVKGIELTGIFQFAPFCEVRGEENNAIVSAQASPGLGIIEYCLIDKDKKHLMSMRIVKYDMSSGNVELGMCIGGEDTRRVTIPVSSLEASVKKFSMEKYGETFRFALWDANNSKSSAKTYEFVREDLKDRKADRLSVFIGQRDNYDLAVMGLGELAFVEHYMEWKDIPNRYRKGNSILVDGKSSKVYVNGKETANEIVKGSTFFKAPPGETKVRFFFSDFCQLTDGNNQPVMDVSAKIREAYL